jgi:hypothetical protein
VQQIRTLEITSNCENVEGGGTRAQFCARVTRDYFTALTIHLKAGSEPVVTLGESAAGRLWPSDAIGKRLLTMDRPWTPTETVENR